MSALRVLALNGSPRAGAGVTSKLLEALLAGMREAGAETELIQVRELNLEPCIGCYSCWVQTPGRCIYSDGMDRGLEAWAAADLAVIGTPVYHGTMTGLLKTFLDRLFRRSRIHVPPHRPHARNGGLGRDPPTVRRTAPPEGAQRTVR